MYSAAVALESPVLAVLGEATAGVGDLADRGLWKSGGCGILDLGDKDGQMEDACGEA